MRLTATTLFTLTLSALFLSACVGKKKHLETINSLTQGYETRIAERDSNLQAADQTITELQLNLAERKGENNALTAMQDKLLDRIDTLQYEIESLNEATLNLEQNMDQALAQKAKEIRDKEKKLQELRALLVEREASLNNIVLELRDTLRSLDSLEYGITSNDGRISLFLTEKLSFVPGSTHRMTKEGIQALEHISKVLKGYPSVYVTVVGHTDNRPAPRNSVRDNWEYSAMRAATVVRVMTGEFYFSTNRITASAQGEFSPKVSNETPEGRAQNRRIELLIQPRQEDLAREIRRRID